MGLVGRTDVGPHDLFQCDIPVVPGDGADLGGVYERPGAYQGVRVVCQPPGKPRHIGRRVPLGHIPRPAEPLCREWTVNDSAGLLVGHAVDCPGEVIGDVKRAVGAFGHVDRAPDDVLVHLEAGDEV